MEHTAKQELELNAFKIRKHTLEMIRTANSGHIGGSFSIAEILSVLYFQQLKVDPAQPRLVLTVRGVGYRIGAGYEK